MSDKTSTNCQNCKQGFEISSDDFLFYEKIDVPPPTFCSLCRMQRRMMFRNERVLYKRTCDATGDSIISIFSPDKPQTVYKSDYWWGDDWDARDYGIEYDPSKHFFDQMRELTLTVPCMDLINDYLYNVNSDYTNHGGHLKDCYLTFNANNSENVLYATTLNKVKDCADGYILDNLELGYECINCSGSEIFYSEDCRECVSTYFSKNCVGCTNIFGCKNLRKKSYYIYNEPYSPAEYKAKLAEMQLDRYSTISELRPQVDQFWLQFPDKYYHGSKNVNCTGDFIYNSKNSHEMYQAKGAEDCKYSQFLVVASSKDCYDLTEWGQNSELVYDSITVGWDTSDVKFCFGSWANAFHTEYCMICFGSEHCFGCVNMKKGKFCILNKQYTESEYHDLRSRIIADMKSNPYVDSQGRTFGYGEFMPYNLSYFAYNESYAAQLFPMNQTEVESAGFVWRPEDPSPHTPTMTANDIPDSIHDVDESICQEVLQCAETNKPYRIVSAELQLLKRFGLPIPRLHPDVRHMNRINRANPPRFWQRKTDDGVDVLTAYAADRPERILSEEAYQNEVM